MAYFKKASQSQLDPETQTANRNAAQDGQFRANLASILSGHSASAKPTQQSSTMT
jgi:hypothetical protein